MIFRKTLKIRLSTVVISSALCIFSVMSTAKTKNFNAYPGTYSAKFVSVNKANSIYLMVAVWDGFPKKIRVTIPGVRVPVIHSKSKSCEIELANKAVLYAKEFFATVQSIKVSDIQMERTDMIDGVASISTELGSLSSKLIQNGFARSSSIADSVPWC